MDTSNNSDLNILKYKGFKSFYDMVDEDKWETKHEGFNYEKKLMQISTSSYMTKNPIVKSFYKHLNRIMVNLIDSVKYLRNFNNYAVKKDYKRIN